MPTLQEAGNARVRQITNSVKDAHHLLLNDPSSRNKLPEQLFKSNFLPLFAGQETQSEVTLGLWVSVAGTPFAEVDIIDDNGQVLFTVPPIFERHIVDPTVPRDMPFSVVADTVEKMLIQNPFRAQAFLHHHLDAALVPDATVEKWRDAYAGRMSEIFKRYGVVPEWEKNAPAVASTSAASPDKPKADLIYDEEIL